MAKYGTPPFFSPKIFFTKMTQNGLKWILNTTLKSMEFCRSDPPPPRDGKIHTFFFFFFEGFPYLNYICLLFQLTFLSSINPTNGSIGLDNIMFTSQKKCLPKWSSLYGYKFHQDIATDNFYKMMFQPRY